MWSRTHTDPIAALDRERFRRRTLFEWRAHLLPARDYDVHREIMRRFPYGDTRRATYARDWLAANPGFQRHVLAELRRRGPLRSRDIPDRAQRPWRSGGWTDGRNVGAMLELLEAGGRIAVAEREGTARVWDLAARVYPAATPRVSASTVAARVLDGQLRARGLATADGFGWALDGHRPPQWERAVRRLVRDGTIVPVSIDGVPGEWFAHRSVLDRPFQGRTAVLAPFDRLLHDRARTELLFDFHYRLEMYVPAAQREFGYYVLPVLHDDRLVGRVDATYHKAPQQLEVRAVFAEPRVPAAAGDGLADELRLLAQWLGAQSVTVGRELPRPWARALRALA